MKNIRDRLGKERVHRLTERKKQKQRRNDTKGAFIYEENGLAVFALAAVMSLGCGGCHRFRGNRLGTGGQ